MNRHLLARAAALFGEFSATKISNVGATAHGQGEASPSDVPTTKRLSRYCPHGEGST